MFKRPLTAIAIACAATALTVVGTAGAAQAANFSATVWTVGGVPGGTMTHIDDGDEFRIYDRDADGKGVKGVLLDANGKVLKSTYNGKGANNGYTYFTYDVKGGNTYYMNVCLVENADSQSGRCNQETLYE